MEAAGGGRRVALVHDYLLVMRGAERTFAELAGCWPDAPIATLLYDADGTAGRFAGRKVITSWLQRLPARQGSFRFLLPLFPAAVERLPLEGYDLVVSSSSAFAHGVRTRPDAKHVCYCHSIFRYAWHERARALRECPAPLRPLLGRVLGRIRDWDRRAAGQVTRYLSNSAITQGRIADAYGIESEVVHPPVDVGRFSPGQPEDYLLFVGELVPHKRVDTAITAARRAGMPLRIVGTGRDEQRLRQLAAGADVEFLGRVPDPDLAQLYARCLALVMPNVEEFGIAAVEAQAAGRPVVAVDAGGAQETVVDGETGILVPTDDPEALAEALAHGDLLGFSTAAARHNAERFSTQEFRRKLIAAVERS